MKVSVFGIGYVGLSLSCMISSKHPVTAVEIIPEKVEMINSGKSPIVDKEISEYLSSGKLDLKATCDASACKGSDFIIVATPTNYDPATDRFDTSSVESVIEKVRVLSPESTVVIKSTIPIGYTEKLYDSGIRNVIFSPEFLREGHALYDNLHPSRIVVGYPRNDDDLKKKAKTFAALLKECSLENNVQTLITGSTEAESVKLFSNTYLAMRIAFFNELDSFAEFHNLNADQMIRGICLDPRIGDWYNNPSFGYGGYCLPKDTKQLLSSFNGVSNNLMHAIVDSNNTRKNFVAKHIMSIIDPEKDTVGAYRLAMKSGSDNYRESSILDIMRILRENGVKVIVYEPTLVTDEYNGFPAVKSLEDLKNSSALILANRMDPCLEDCRSKVYTRDIFTRD